MPITPELRRSLWGASLAVLVGAVGLGTASWSLFHKAETQQTMTKAALDQQEERWRILRDTQQKIFEIQQTAIATGKIPVDQTYKQWHQYLDSGGNDQSAAAVSAPPAPAVPAATLEILQAQIADLERRVKALEQRH